MENLRAVLAQLPFVSENSDGTLDFWSVTPSGDFRTEVAAGREYFSHTLAVARRFKASSILHSMDCARHRTPGILCSITVGWMHELASTLRAADPRCPLLASVDDKHFPEMDIRKGMCMLPFVSERRDGTLDLWDVDPNEEFSTAQARGRLYAALTAKYLRDTAHPSLLVFMDAAVAEERRADPIRVGFLNALMEIAMYEHGTLGADDTSSPLSEDMPLTDQVSRAA